ncbi:hypothetical protein Ddye_011743 [Dipteronia dyeriana]|uniref:Glycosyltransferase n=1 Tax=Dipteronia dyeriana TaxID=168575 RepID=A0AAD9X377_9ROSI|nr:hypothetical protein Ddye_011743 [Dipteronia dyeriana]
MSNQNSLKPQQQHEQVVVVMVPFPAQGHLNQLLQLSRLLLSYGIPIHYVGTASHNRQAKVRVHGWNPVSLAASNIRFHDFEIPPFRCSLPDPNATINFPSHLQPCFDAAAKHLIDPVTVLLRSLSSKNRKVIIIHDSLMGSVIQEARFIPNVESYSFHSVSAFTVYLYKWEAMQGNTLVANDVIPKEIPSLEGCFTSEFMDFVNSEYDYHKFNSGSLYNTSRVIESAYMELLEQSTIAKNTKHWALGPFNPVAITKSKQKDSNRKHYCLEWLDKQAPNSVVYVSFGTTTAMNDEQIKELAVGLKQSDQKFIWVLRDADIGDVFDENQVRRAKLPKGYEDSIKDKGLVVRDWAPQLEILGHPSTGGFVGHCGWNSCMESITMGVPIGAWPMHSDQPRNTVLITQVLKVGIVVKDWSKHNEIVTSNRVEKAVKILMVSKDGDEMRKRAIKLSRDVRRSMDEGGASRMEMDSFVAHITRVG